MAAAQRLKQGLRALTAFARSVDHDLAACYLTTNQLACFLELSRSEQLHSINVLRMVLEQEDTTPPDLAAAALLHDVGKSRYTLAVWQKTLGVLVERLLPKLANHLNQRDDITFWRAPFVVRRYHPVWGAEILKNAGASERLLWLVAHHADPLSEWNHHPDIHLLRRLKAADDAN